MASLTSAAAIDTSNRSCDFHFSALVWRKVDICGKSRQLGWEVLVRCGRIRAPSLAYVAFSSKCPIEKNPFNNRAVRSKLRFTPLRLLVTAGFAERQT